MVYDFPSNPVDGQTYDTGVGTIYVFVDGIGWEVQVSASGSVKRDYEYISTEGQTVITGADRKGKVLEYDVGYVEVYVEGIRQVPGDDFTATDGSNVTLTSSVVAGLDIQVEASGVFSNADHYTKAEVDDLQETSTESSSILANQTTMNGAIDSDVLDMDMVETTGSTPILYIGQDTVGDADNNPLIDNGDGTWTLDWSAYHPTLQIANDAEDWAFVTSGDYTIGEEAIDNSATGDARSYVNLTGVNTSVSPVLDTTNWKLAANQYGYMFDIKARTISYDMHRYDSIRGVSNFIHTNSTALEDNDVTALSTVGTNSLTLGAQPEVNKSANTYVLWIKQTTRKTAGYRTDAGVMQNSKNNTGTDLMEVDSAGNPIISHYNPSTGFEIIMRTGNGVAGTTIPHHLQKKPKTIINKLLETTALDWMVYNAISGASKFLNLNDTGAIGDEPTVWNSTEPTDSNFTIGTNATVNTANKQNITYLQADSDNHKTKGYNGSSEAGNVVELGLDMTVKGSWCMIKRLDTTGRWVITDSLRGSLASVYADGPDVEYNPNVFDVQFSTTGVIIGLTDTYVNASGGQYLIQAYSPKYNKPTDGSKIGVNSGKRLTFTQGLGLVNIEETTIASEIDLASFANQTAYILKDRGLTPVGSNQELSVGQNRLDADRWGTTIENGLYKTTDVHGGYESATGVVSASSYYDETRAPFRAFDRIDSADNCWLSSAGIVVGEQLRYKLDERRVLKSFRFNHGNSSGTLSTSVGRCLREYKVIGVLNGVETEIGSNLGSPFVPTSYYEWSGLLDLSSNIIAYDSYYIEVVTNNGDGDEVTIGEVQFNFEISDKPYLNTLDKVVYDENDVATETIALGEVKIDGQGNTFDLVNYLPLKNYFNDIVATGDIETTSKFVGNGAYTALVSFDGTTIPPTIKSSFNIVDVIRISTGIYDVYFDEEMDNIDYIISGVGVNDDTETGGRVICERYEHRSKFKCRIYHVYSTNALDRPHLSISISGGKN